MQSRTITEILDDLPACIKERNRGAFYDFVHDLRYTHERAKYHPTLFKGNRLSLKRLDDANVSCLAPEGETPYRPTPACMRESISSIRLVWPLSDDTSEDVHSRVWLAEVGGTGEQVVAKVYCPSFYVPVQLPGKRLGRMTLPLQDAEIEEVAYKALASAQGSWAPYFIGRYATEFKHGETAHVLLLENIEGESLFAWRARHVLEGFAEHQRGTPQEIEEFERLHTQHTELMGTMMNTISRMHDLGILHCDLHGQNIIMTDRSPTGFVFIDFGRARDIGINDTPIDIHKPARSLLCCYEHAAALRAWCLLNGYDDFTREHWGGLYYVLS